MIENLKERLYYFAKLLNIDVNLIKEIEVDEKFEYEASVHLPYNVEEYRFKFNTLEAKDEHILHELLHIKFKNTVNGISLFEEENKIAHDFLMMLHEQEIDSMSKTLANILRSDSLNE